MTDEDQEENFEYEVEGENVIVLAEGHAVGNAVAIAKSTLISPNTDTKVVTLDGRAMPTLRAKFKGKHFWYFMAMSTVLVLALVAAYAAGELKSKVSLVLCLTYGALLTYWLNLGRHYSDDHD